MLKLVLINEHFHWEIFTCIKIFFKIHDTIKTITLITKIKFTPCSSLMSNIQRYLLLNDDDVFKIKSLYVHVYLSDVFKSVRIKLWAFTYITIFSNVYKVEFNAWMNLSWLKRAVWNVYDEEMKIIKNHVTYMISLIRSIQW